MRRRACALRRKRRGVTTCVIPEPFLDEDATTEYLEMDGVLLAYHARRGERRLYRVAEETGAGRRVVRNALAGVRSGTSGGRSSGNAGFRWAGDLSAATRGAQSAALPQCTSSALCMRNVSGMQYRLLRARDPRITRVGRILRHTCIDELPQLVNVLRGEMRWWDRVPEMPFVVEQYEPIHLKRLSVLPGLTGLWQLSASRPAGTSSRKYGYDLYYLRHQGVLNGAVAILLHTLVFAFRGV